MGERGKNNEKNDEMTSQKTNFDPAEPAKDKPETRDSARSHKPEVRLGREAQARIGEQLRAMYNTFINQGVPDQFVDLVRRLSEQD
jgi:Anti-sigma factor NepR